MSNVVPALLKTRLDYGLLLRTLGIPYRPEEGEGALYFRCLNPRHEDRDPSMKVQFRDRGTAKAGLWRCWNHACQLWSGDIFDLVRVMRACTFREAVQFIADLTEGVSGAEILAALAAEDIRAASATLDPEFPSIPFPTLLPEPHVPLPVTHPYFSQVRDPAVDARWGVRDGCVLVTGGEYEGYMAVPIRWIDGTVVTYQCIAVEPWAVERRREKFGNEKAAQSKLYPPNCPIDRVLYGCEHVRPQGVVVLQEGVFDNWRTRSAVHGMDDFYPVAAMSNRLAKAQVALLRQLRPREVVVLPDNDPSKSGERPGDHLLLETGGALAYSLPVTVAEIPEGEDPDSAGVEAIREALRRRVGYGGWVARWATPPRPNISLNDIV